MENSDDKLYNVKNLLFGQMQKEVPVLQDPLFGQAKCAVPASGDSLEQVH